MYNAKYQPMNNQDTVDELKNVRFYQKMKFWEFLPFE